MKNPERINTTTFRSVSRSLTPFGWLFIYGLAAFMAGAIYAMTRMP